MTDTYMKGPEFKVRSRTLRAIGSVLWIASVALLLYAVTAALTTTVSADEKGAKVYQVLKINPVGPSG